MTPEQIKQFIESGLPCDHVEVAGDGQHFEAVIVSAAFRGKNKVQQHQLVYRALGERMREEIHALSMQTHTPEEFVGLRNLSDLSPTSSLGKTAPGKK